MLVDKDCTKIFKKTAVLKLDMLRCEIEKQIFNENNT